MQIIKNDHVQLYISLATINPMKWGLEVYQNAWVREDQDRREHGVKLAIADIGPFNIYFQVMTKKPIDDQLWEGTWPGKGWNHNPNQGTWYKWWKLGGKKK